MGLFSIGVTIFTPGHVKLLIIVNYCLVPLIFPFWLGLFFFFGFFLYIFDKLVQVLGRMTHRRVIELTPLKKQIKLRTGKMQQC